jgi:hypothetical protein
MKTPTLKLPQQVIPQRVEFAQTKADNGQGLKTLEQLLPREVSQGFKENGFTGAIDAIQNLDDKKLLSFARNIEEISNTRLPDSVNELRNIFESDDFASSFIKAFKSSLKAAKENPEAALADPIEFVRSQLEKLSEAPKAVLERVPVVGKVTLASKTESPNRDLAEVLAANAA